MNELVAVKTFATFQNYLNGKLTREADKGTSLIN
jgi:hypothetical protein